MSRKPCTAVLFGGKMETLPPLPIDHNHYSLKGLSKALLGVKIQASAHSALEDTAATIRLYRISYPTTSIEELLRNSTSWDTNKPFYCT